MVRQNATVMCWHIIVKILYCKDKPLLRLKENAFEYASSVQLSANMMRCMSFVLDVIHQNAHIFSRMPLARPLIVVRCQVEGEAMLTLPSIHEKIGPTMNSLHHILTLFLCLLAAVCIAPLVLQPKQE